MQPSSTVLVTGATGLLGRAVVRRLLQSGVQVMTLGRRSWNESPVCRHAVADLTDAQAVMRACAETPLSAILHLAAVIPGNDHSDADFAANNQMTANLLAVAENSCVRQFVAASSCCLYGTPTAICTEDAPLQVRGAYARSKLEDERLVAEAGQRSGIACSSLRIAPAYGAWSIVPTVVNKFLTQAASADRITLYGSGGRQQHFVHQSDVARAFELAMKNDARGIFNVSGPAPTTMKELAEECVALFGNRCPVIHTGEDPQEIYVGCFPWKRAHEAFGYEPKMSLREGLHETAREMGLL